MARFLRLLLASCVAVLTLTGTAQAAGGNYVFDGGNANQQAQVTAALNVSTFNWSVVPDQITIHIAPNLDSRFSNTPAIFVVRFPRLCRIFRRKCRMDGDETVLWVPRARCRGERVGDPLR